MTLSSSPSTRQFASSDASLTVAVRRLTRSEKAHILHACDNKFSPLLQVRTAQVAIVSIEGQAASDITFNRKPLAFDRDLFGIDETTFDAIADILGSEKLDELSLHALGGLTPEQRGN